MEALRTPKTAIKKIILGSRGSRGGPPSPVPFFPTIRSSVFSSVGVGGMGEARCKSAALCLHSRTACCDTSVHTQSVQSPL